jgi:small subunit ribosomal protein S1
VSTSQIQPKKPQTMADLLKSAQTSFVKVGKSDVLEGIITKLTSSEILVDIGAKTEAVVLEKDKKLLRTILSNLKVGDKVSVSVLNPESDMGNPVVSLRRFIGDRLWEELDKIKKEKKVIEVSVNEITRGGFTISTKEGVAGFLPNSQISFAQVGEGIVGKTMNVVILELNRSLQKVIFSQKAISGSENFQKATKILKPGEVLEVSISSIAPFGVFVSLKVEDKTYSEGFIHISEISWDKLSQVPEEYKVGNNIKAKVLGFDKKAERVNLSIRELSKNPFEEKLEEIVVDKKVEGVVSKIISTGVLVDLNNGIEGIIKKDKIPPTISYKVGSPVQATVSSIDKKKYRAILTPILKEKPIGYR